MLHQSQVDTDNGHSAFSLKQESCGIIGRPMDLVLDLGACQGHDSVSLDETCRWPGSRGRGIRVMSGLLEFNSFFMLR